MNAVLREAHFARMARGASTVRLEAVGDLEVRLVEKPGASVGSITWGGAQALARLLLQRDVSGLTVLELGSGTGLAGLTAALKGAHVVLTERQQMMQQLQESVDLNAEAIAASAGSATVRELDWTEPPADLLERTYDLVIAADVVYLPALAQPLVAVLARVISSACLLSYKLRDETADALFFEGLARAGVVVEELGGSAEGDRLLALRPPRLEV